MSFAEVRPYQSGDDVRSIDWNVTARKRSPYIKVFEEERELTLFLVIDSVVQPISVRTSAPNEI